MPEVTNKQLLEQIRLEQKDSSEKFFEYAQTMSNFMNRQSELNIKWNNYLESNSATNQEGVVEKLDRVEKTLIEYKSSIDKKIAFVTGACIAVFSIGKWLIAKIFV